MFLSLLSSWDVARAVEHQAGASTVAVVVEVRHTFACARKNNHDGRPTLSASAAATIDIGGLADKQPAAPSSHVAAATATATIELKVNCNFENLPLPPKHFEEPGPLPPNRFEEPLPLEVEFPNYDCAEKISTRVKLQGVRREEIVTLRWRRLVNGWLRHSGKVHWHTDDWVLVE